MKLERMNATEEVQVRGREIAHPPSMGRHSKCSSSLMTFRRNVVQVDEGFKLDGLFLCCKRTF